MRMLTSDTDAGEVVRAGYSTVFFPLRVLKSLSNSTVHEKIRNTGMTKFLQLDYSWTPAPTFYAHLHLFSPFGLFLDA